MILEELTIRNLILTLESCFDPRINYTHTHYKIRRGFTRGCNDNIEYDLYLRFVGGYSFLITIKTKDKVSLEDICAGVREREKELEEIGFINDLEDTEPQKLMQEAKELLEKESVAPKDNVNHPSHYNQGKIECIEAIESATIGKSGIEAVCVANVIKYLWRYEKKGGKESVEKAMWYLNRLLRVLEEK